MSSAGSPNGPRWKAAGWRTAGRQPVRNRDLWERLDAVNAAHAVEWVWVRGHSGHVENELVDQAARAAIPGAGASGS